MKTLHLNLKGKWFDMILSGEKTEEYRDLTEYWRSRLMNFAQNEELLFKADSFTIKVIPHGYSHKIIFSNGYTKDRRQMVVEFKGIQVRGGKESWGAKKGKKYYVLKLGNIISTKNCHR